MIQTTLDLPKSGVNKISIGTTDQLSDCNESWGFRGCESPIWLIGQLKWTCHARIFYCCTIQRWWCTKEVSLLVDSSAEKNQACMFSRWNKNKWNPRKFGWFPGDGVASCKPPVWGLNILANRFQNNHCGQLCYSNFAHLFFTNIIYIILLNILKS